MYRTLLVHYQGVHSLYRAVTKQNSVLNVWKSWWDSPVQNKYM